MKKTIFAAIVAGLMLTTPHHAMAQDAEASAMKMRDHTIGVMGGSVTGTNSRLAWDMAKAMDTPDAIRILPIMGRGSAQAVLDILFLDSVDAALVQSDILSHYIATGAVEDIENRLVYLAKFHNEEIHVLAPTSISDIGGLDGKRVNFGSASSGGAITAGLMFERLGLDVTVTHYNHAKAIDEMRAGNLDAMVRVVGKPTSTFADLGQDDGFHFLSVPFDKIGAPYFSTTLSAADYPDLIGADAVVDTIAVAAVLATQNRAADTAGYKKIASFMEALRANLDTLKEGSFNDKWDEIDLAAEVPGWTRFGSE